MFKKLLVISALTSLLLLTACTLGSQIPTTQTVPTLVGENLPPEVAVEIQNRLSETLGVAVDQIEIVTVEREEWPNSCLGLGGQDEVCAEVITPGWLVELSVEGAEYRYRADETGTNIRQEP